MANQPSLPFPELLGDMYKRYVLDCIVDLAYAVALDFSTRPHLYQGINTASELTDLQSSYGFAGNFPNKEIRAMLYRPIFGEWETLGSASNGGPFKAARLHLLAAAVALAENQTNTPRIGDDSLIEGVRSASLPFINHLLDLEGDSFSQTDARTESVFATSECILKDPGVTGIFGVTVPIDPAWSLQSNDRNGAKLIEQITTQLPNSPAVQMTRDGFIQRQRVAEKGCSSIIGILDSEIEKDDAKVLQVNKQLNAWARELGLMIGGATPQ